MPSRSMIRSAACRITDRLTGPSGVPAGAADALDSVGAGIGRGPLFGHRGQHFPSLSGIDTTMLTPYVNNVDTISNWACTGGLLRR